MFLLWPISSYQHKANEHSIKKKYIYQLYHHQQKTNGGMQTGEATVENNMEFPQKTKNGTAL